MSNILATHFLPVAEIVLRLAMAAGLGLLLGLDRELKNKPVGIRGYMMVALGAAGFAILNLELGGALHSQENGFSIDPSRSIQGLIGGIGFLGAGAIIHRKAGVRGMATGAGIWLSGAIGMACGFGSYLLAFSLTGIAVFILVVVGFIRKRADLSLKD